MFGNFRERLENVKHDVSLGWKSFSDKAKSVNQKIVRKTTFITEEYVEGQDQCFNCDFEAGSEILEKFHKEWADIHEKSRSSAQEAENADQVINSVLKKCTELRNTMSILHGELDQLSDVIKNVQSATDDIVSIGSQTDTLEDLLMDLEEVCEKLDVERHKNSHRLKVVMLQQSKLDDLEKLKEDLQLENTINNQRKENLERQESIERQKVYEDAFIEQMNYYIQFGKTDEHVASSAEQGGSLADIKLYDFGLDKQLDDFLGPSNEEPEDPSIPTKAPDRPKHKRKSPKSKSKIKSSEPKSKGKKETIQEPSIPQQEAELKEKTGLSATEECHDLTEPQVEISDEQAQDENEVDTKKDIKQEDATQLTED